MTLVLPPRSGIPVPVRHRDSWGRPIRTPSGRAFLVDRSGLRDLDVWHRTGIGSRHDYRFFELVDETIRQGFEYFYLVLEDHGGEVIGIQPVFIHEQNLLEGVTGRLLPLVSRLRRAAPKLLTLRTLMVGSPVGEGILGSRDDDPSACVHALADALLPAARQLRAPLIVLKEFPSVLRPALDVFLHRGYSRVPSMPYATLNLDFHDFDDHMTRSLSASVRKDLRRKFRDAAKAPPITMEVTDDISDRVQELYPLYQQVYRRATLRFEELTPDFLRRLGREMPDRARFFIWSQQGRPIAFNLCTLHDGALWADYLGMDYSCALDLHLYFIVTRDEINWCCRNGLRRYCSSSLNYDPKLHLRFTLSPVDLYVRHANRWANSALRGIVPWLTPVSRDGCLRRFPNWNEV